MSKIVKKEEMEVNIDLLPEPTKRVEAANVSIYQWGWPGFNLDHDFLAKYEHNVGKLLPVILSSSNGVFFILIKDKIKKRWIFFSDLYACKKIFYMQKGKMIYLTDFLYKFKSLLNTHNEIDAISIGLFLMYGYIPGNDTLYKSVKSLKPFTYLEYKANKLKEYSYYHIEFDEINMPYREACENTMKLMEQRLLSLTRNYKSFLVPLSGGRDSRFLLALILKHFSKDQIATFTFGQPGTFDFEIGKGFAKKHKIDAICLPFNPEDYFEEYIMPGMKYKNGLINHVLESPAKFYEKNLNSHDDPLIVSGFIGDAVLAWAHQRKIIADENNFLYPVPSHFSLNDVVNMSFPQYKEEYYSRLKKLTARLYDKDRKLEPEKWLYQVHASFFTSPCMFSEEKFYPFALPFIDQIFFEYIKGVPAVYKAKYSFYEDVLKIDPYIYGFFHYPLKNRRGFGYGNNKIINMVFRCMFYSKSVFSGARPMKNYINFNKIYTGPFLDSQIGFFKQFPGFHYILNKENLTQKQKILLFSLKLNLETFF